MEQTPFWAFISISDGHLETAELAEMGEEENTGEEMVKNFIGWLAQYIREPDAQEK